MYMYMCILVCCSTKHSSKMNTLTNVNPHTQRPIIHYLFLLNEDAIKLLYPQHTHTHTHTHTQLHAKYIVLITQCNMHIHMYMYM